MMKIYQKYFCYGSIFTSLAWGLLIYLYIHVQDHPDRKISSWPSMQSKKHVRLKPRHNDLQMHHNDNFDFIYGHDNLENEDSADVINFKRQPAPLQPNEHNHSIRNQDLSELGIIKTPEDQKIRDKGYRLHAFNQLISDRIGPHRDIPDTRHTLCQQNKYAADLPKASIIICFINEAWSTLLRTIYSILDRTPEQYIHEIILVDDGSDHVYLSEHLKEFISANLPLVKLIRTGSRQGLIRARVFGAEHATGEVLVFLDSHCEVNEQWIEPLLNRIHVDPTIVSIPIIDIINQDSFVYEASPLVRGGFNWGLHFRWDQLPGGWLSNKADFVKPIKTATMAGGLFAIDRTYFNKMGKYDPGMDVWGGENLELSFRIWMCGGSLEILPCSRVGHVFRKRRPYPSPGGDAMTHNSLRVAHVWMDDYKDYYFMVRPEAKHQSYGDISNRVNLRQQLGCHSFKWYLDEIYPEQTLPSANGGGGFAKGNLPSRHEIGISKKGWLQHRSSGMCVVADSGVLDKKSLLKLELCNSKNKEQIWYATDEHSLQLTGVLCMDIQDQGYPRLMKCHYSGGTQEWKWIGTGGLLLNPASGKCLALTDDVHMGSNIAMELCNYELHKQLGFVLKSSL